MTEERVRPLVTVDLGVVAANTGRLAARTEAALMAVVKADGFGHGAVPVARTALAHGATRLGVATADEALALRGAGLTAPVLSWLNAPQAELTPAVDTGIELAVPSFDHLQAVAAAAHNAGRAALIHLHADVGMARDGAAHADWPRLCGHAAALERTGRIRVIGVMGHLGCADTPDDRHNAGGRDRFDEAVRSARSHGLRPRLRHLAATAAVLNDPAAHHDMVRVGAGLYGIDSTGRAGLQWAMTLTAPVVCVRDVPAGTPVGYGHTWTTDRCTRLALLPLGYGDGLPRAASGRAEVLLNGRRRPVVGRISMDQIVVDAGQHPVQAGDVATVLGPGTSGEPTPADWARWAGTLPHELLTTIGSGHRVARRHRPCTVTHEQPTSPVPHLQESFA
ncbi:alanine racemase [Streptomyces sp. M41]|uniref:alanine racemase n=1 Tax=Streptomyces sp. M41 TaxID=3059412 RepID=UPI00374DDC8D